MPEPKNELGYGDIDARPDDGPDSTHPDGEGAGGGQSGGGARNEPVETTGGGGSPGGQTDPAYRGGSNPNSVRQGDGSDAQ